MWACRQRGGGVGLARCDSFLISDMRGGRLLFLQPQLCLTMFCPTPHAQSYRMHLKSSNGPIDVLVCPEGDEQQAPTEADRDLEPAPPTTATDSAQYTLRHFSSSEGGDLNVSLSSAIGADDLEGLVQDYDLDSSTLLASDLTFESLSPPLQETEFCFSLDTGEGIGDLFDLVSS